MIVLRHHLPSWATRRLIAFLCLAFAWVGYAAEPAVVDLNKPDTLLALFESGAHPRRAFRNGGDGFLVIRPAQSLGFRVESLFIPPTKAPWRFMVGRNDQLLSIQGSVEEAWTKAEAFEKTKGLESAMGGDLEALKKWIDFYPSPSPSGDLWGRKWRSADGTRSVSYYFRHTMQGGRPLTISVVVELHWPGREIGFRETPVEPPAGYEHVDMSFDETYGGTAKMPHAKNARATDTAAVMASHDWSKFPTLWIVLGNLFFSAAAATHLWSGRRKW
ncbi:hypothetical protein [Roseimicrobium sp. ORNL1]|uniref:hypothetical protein n=1 Tax=Roseimicrobium sp. ORNL1 TaxID=2711231 RepID=UPI0013E0ECB1|nr:hypothetical protein [Roseimicrobium sp. ORNL1]QIF05570.1 hypothetical protein G5S37_30090 [Roseimicrobium sp. ORNL1]